ncbi:MAG TPA: amino acid ABC transporter permease [Anaeromyxobacter sp.]|jgi:polar amino acid transport system permease protein|nr:amino acid ABC transporter permease [Anaeromyxobacter sp.]
MIGGLLLLWPQGWSRERKSTATMAVAALGLVLFLLVLGHLLAAAPDPIGPNAAEFAKGTWVTLELTILSGLFGIAVGVLAAVARMSRLPPLRWIAGFYIWVFRGTPLLVQILFVYFALPGWLSISDFSSATLALGLNVGAYNAEAIRAGLQAVPKGQTEAARSLGLKPLQTFGYVVFPQGIKIALPPLVNNVVSLLKDSSLAYSIGVIELANVGGRVHASTFQPVPIFTTTAIIYLALTTLLTQISGAIEHRLDVEGRI